MWEESESWFLRPSRSSRAVERKSSSHSSSLESSLLLPRLRSLCSSIHCSRLQYFSSICHPAYFQCHIVAPVRSASLYDSIQAPGTFCSSCSIMLQKFPAYSCPGCWYHTPHPDGLEPYLSPMISYPGRTRKSPASKLPYMLKSTSARERVSAHC